MNDTEAKAMFFAQYLNQIVFTHKDWECFNDKSLKPVDPTYLQCGSNRLSDGYLILRSIDQLTDEHLRQVIDLYNLYFSGEKEPIDAVYFDVETGEIEYYYPQNNGCATIQYYELPKPCTDYLIRIGYLIEFTHINENNEVVTLQPAEIIAKGWAQIKQ